MHKGTEQKEAKMSDNNNKQTGLTTKERVGRYAELCNFTLFHKQDVVFHLTKQLQSTPLDHSIAR